MREQDVDEDMGGKFIEFTDGGGPRAQAPHEFAEDLARADIADLYSEFATQYPIAYAATIQPYLRVLRQPVLKRRLFSSATEVELERFGDSAGILAAVRGEPVDDPTQLTAGHKLLAPGSAVLSWWLDLCEVGAANSPSRRWFDAFNSTLTGGVSRAMAVKLGDLLRNSGEGYVGVLSPLLLDALKSTMASIPDRSFAMFADLPMFPLWIETAVNQLGTPHHANIDAHRRIKYRSQKRTMFVDIFCLDRCRPFYDWLPLPELYGDDLSRVSRQMVARLCLDAIAKQTNWILPYSLRYASVVPKHGQFHFGFLRKRVTSG